MTKNETDSISRRGGPISTRRRLVAAAAVAGSGALTANLSGCSSSGDSGSASDLEKKIDNPSDKFNRKGFPISDDPISVQFMTGRAENTASDYNKVANWKNIKR